MSKFQWSDSPSQTAWPVARAGFSFILTGAFITVICALLSLTIPALVGLVITLFMGYFFRDPTRSIPAEQGIAVSPADGKVIGLETVANSDFDTGASLKISIFMSIFNVHVNRIPCTGTVTDVSYHPGRFFSANLDKASRDNEHNAVFVQTDQGERICFVQIAGFIARRIICHINKGDHVKRGQRFGIICFGSRLDVYLPVSFQPQLQVGQRVKAGASVLGVFK